MEIRPYHPNDDPALMQLERLSARGFPKPFVHFRRRFIDRANLYENALTLIAEIDNTVVGVTSIIVKETLVNYQEVKIAYSFDTRVHPNYRRMGIGSAMVEEKLKWAENQGADGVYSLIVTTNQASMGMVDKSGYHKAKMILYLQYTPSPMFTPMEYMPHCSMEPIDQDLIHNIYQDYDLYTPDIAERVAHLEFQRWRVRDENGARAGLSVYNQAMVYCKVPADDPWPKTDADIQRLGRNWQMFDVTGLENDHLIEELFQQMRDEAVMQNVNKIVWMADRSENIPPVLLNEAYQQTDYWLMYKSFSGLEPHWGNLVYLDPRDL